MGQIDSGSKSSRLLASRRYTHNTYTTAQESFTEVLDLGASEIYTQASKIPSSGLPFSGSSQLDSNYADSGDNILKYWYRQKLTKSNVNNEVWFFLDPTGSDSGVGAQLINDNQQTNFVSPKYSDSSLANSTTEDTTPGYLAVLYKSSAISQSAQTSSLASGDIVSTNDYQFDYKTGIVQFMNSAVDPTDSEYCFMTVNQYVGKTLAEGVEVSGDLSGSSSSTGSFGRLEVAGNSSLTGDITIGGNMTFGNADTDSLAITADLSSSIIPDADSTYDVGSSTKNWRFGYIEQVVATHVTASSNISASGNLYLTGNADIDGTSNLASDLYVGGNITGSNDISASGNLSITGNADIDGTSNFAGNVTMQNDLTVTGRIDAEEIHTTFISSSITQATGSNIFGDNVDDSHQFTGSIDISGSGTVLKVSDGNVVVSDTLTATNIGAFTSTGAIDFDSQNMTNVDIDSGTIDGTTLGTNSYTTIKDFTNLSGSSTATASLGSHLYVGGNITGSNNISASGNIYGTGNLDIDGTANIAGDTTLQSDLSVVDINASGNITASGEISASGNLSATGNLDIDGSTNLQGNVTLQGDIDVDGTTNLDNTDIDGTLTVDGTNTTITSTIVSLVGAVTASSNVSASGNLSATGNLDIDGTSNLASDLYVGGNITGSNDISASGNLYLTGNTDIDGYLTVAGSITGSSHISASGNIYGANITASSGISTTDIRIDDYIYHNDDPDTYIGFPTGDKFDVKAGGINFIHAWQKDSDTDKLWFNKNEEKVNFRFYTSQNSPGLQISASGDVGIHGIQKPSASLHVGGNLLVDSHITSSGDISGSYIGTGSFGRLEVVGNSNLTGDLTLGGNITIGDATSDSVSFGAEVSSSMIPDADSSYDIGSSSKNWRFGYIEQVVATHVTASSNISASGNLYLTGNADIDGYLTVAGSITGSSHISGSSTSTGSFGNVNVSEMSIPSVSAMSASVATKLNTLEADIIALAIALG